MDFQRKNKISADFNMASMTDLIFLLLIFFMLTSNFVTPSSMPINLPSTKKQGAIVIPKITISISKDLRYLINDRETTIDLLEFELKNQLTPGEENVVVLNVDRDVPTQYFVKVAGIANSLGARVSLATKTE